MSYFNDVPVAPPSDGDPVAWGIRTGGHGAEELTGPALPHELGPAPIAGVPCRVCGETDDDERARVDLHTRCVELAAHRAKAKRRVLRHHRELTHDQLVAKLARARAAAPQPDEPEAVVADHDLTHDELGPGALATEGLS